MKQHKGGSEILIPLVDFESATITTRRAPSPQRHVGIGGWIEWCLIDRQGRVVRGGEQHNLFLNQGLDRIASVRLSSPSWFSRACVGTGSIEPAVSGTALTAEVARTSGGAVSDSLVRASDGVYEFNRVFEFDYAVANGNLTEWGIAGSASGDLIVWELFRDGMGDPIVISKTSDYKLRISYTCQLTLTPTTVQAGSFTIAGIGLINGTYRWHGAVTGQSAAFSDMDMTVFGLVAAATVGTTDTGVGFLSASVGPATYSAAASVGTRQDIMDTTRSYSGFVSGTWERSITPVWGTASGNAAAIASLGIIGGQASGSNARAPGFLFVVDENDRFTKDNEHMLTINDLLTVTWGRA